jgi:hypothetical protein
VRKATGPDRELDEEIARAVGMDIRRVTLRGIVRNPVCLPLGGRWQSIPRFTESLDAAMQLVPEGWLVSHMWIDLLENRSGANLRKRDEQKFACAEARFPALALVCASLLAQGGE